MGILRRNNVRVSGHGQQPMVFAHGFGCDQVMWRFVSPAFEPDYQVVLFDYVGAGHSDLDAYDPQRYATLDGYALDLVDICEALDLNDVILVGPSVSSAASCLKTLTQSGTLEVPVSRSIVGQVRSNINLRSCQPLCSAEVLPFESKAK